MPIPSVEATHDLTLRLTQADFDTFADLSGDDNPIHVDPAFSARTRFGRTVAHGMLLFALLDAATIRWLGEPLVVRGQELSFRAPTFADEALTAGLTLLSRNGDEVRVGQTLHRSDGVETAAGHTIVGRTHQPEPADPTSRPLAEPAEVFGIRPGMRASSQRIIGVTDVTALCELVDNPNPRYRLHGEIPPPLLGGLVSHLLGVELPGRGTNWLRQRYVFHHPVQAGSTVETSVEVTRVRPAKALVNLATTCTADGRIAVTGDALVLISDLEQAPLTEHQ